VFGALGYSGALTLAVVAGVLQFLPVVGPSVLVGALVVYQLLAGDAAAAALVGVAGAVFIGYLPDVLIRARLARRSADMPSTLYFTGFTGGLLTLGPVGIIAGLLAVALLVEGIELLSAETDGYQQSTLSERGDPTEMDEMDSTDIDAPASFEEEETAETDATDGHNSPPDPGSIPPSDP
jgi:predicted PurR-regulated permease PerM